MPPNPTPGWGQAPALHFSWDPGLSLLGDGRWCRRPVPESIPDRSPGHVLSFQCSCRLVPAHQGMKMSCSESLEVIRVWWVP